ncbi:hypothetical protein BH708_17735 [Brachybacterium sp. P6-10-X1]|uniref:hypothetical protein n=1 Tax=Brachybacterium sp. P6-10-X1 TaxID=1903186 RepID=UPI0009718F73|nr:hypothetical protein [Brachybacterium sp. P6-10-X1]APX34242.1 hypothetical protein BH708_17735 [Brachybacterium sp. P6-10-X1]
MHHVPQHDQDRSPAHGPVIPGELVPTGSVDPDARTDDPPAGTAGPQQPQQAPLQPYAAPPWPPHAAGPPPVPPPPEKSVGVAFVLTFFFGPFGMFYSTVAGALILLGITLGIALLAGVVIGLITLATFGLGAFLVALAPLAGVPVWIASIIWGCLAASGHNDRVRAEYAQHGAAHAQYGARRAAFDGYRSAGY